MAENGEYKFAIDVFTPLTLSMKRLNEYIADLVDLFGNEEHVHFIRVEEGSAAPLMYVDPTVISRLEKRFFAISTGNASSRAMDAYASLNDKLVDDNAVADLTGAKGRLLYFPGRERELSPEVGPVTENTSLEGEVIQIGGRDASIQVYLRDGENIHICTTSRERGREIAKYLFEGKVRVYGAGKWKRTKDDIWKQVGFTIESFKPTKTDSLVETVKRLRSINSPELSKVGDPIEYLDELNRETGDNHKK